MHPFGPTRLLKAYRQQSQEVKENAGLELLRNRDVNPTAAHAGGADNAGLELLRNRDVNPTAAHAGGEENAGLELLNHKVCNDGGWMQI
jgi:hypothetical protein